MKRQKMALLILLIGLAMLTTGCLPGDGASTKGSPAGFFSGIWHGWIAPLSLVLGIFNRAIRIYEPINTGWWYDLGFYAAVIGGFGSISLFRRRSNRK
jgi:hypothetical protein